MEIKEGKLFTFSVVVNGQGFSFTTAADSRPQAAKDLHDKLALIVEELNAEVVGIQRPN